MNHWSIDILRQSGFDLWTGLCVIASVLLIMRALAARLWTSKRGWLLLELIAVGVAGTAAFCAIPAIRSPLAGMVWTVVLLSILSAAFYVPLQDELGTARMVALLAMRVAAIGLLVTMLFEPVLRFVQRPAPQRPLICLIDASGSMSLPDSPNGPSRFQTVWRTLRTQLSKINEHFVPQYFTFASDVNPLRQPQDLAAASADGQSTDIARALGKGLAAAHRDDAVVLLISDGADNISANVTDAVRDSRIKVCTLTVGSEQGQPELPNVAVDKIACDDFFAVGRASQLIATIKSTALPNRLVDVKMSEIGSDGKPLGEISDKQLVLQPIAAGQNVNFSFTPKSTGIHRVAVWIDPIPGERTASDNRREVAGLALEQQIKVLYVEGRVRPEYRYLNRALGRDPDVELSTLLRIQGTRFAAAGENADQRLTELPTSERDWRPFDVIILGDLDSSFLTADQQAAIEHAVADGAGLLVIGGQNNFGPGGFSGTPIEKALPVNVGAADGAQDKSEFVPQLTADGMGHPITSGLSDWFIGPDGQSPAQALAPLKGNVVVASAKTGAQILLVHPGAAGQTPQIVLAVQRYGKGRSAAFTADTTYLWRLAIGNTGNDPYDRFWGQLVGWLANEESRNRQNTPGLIALFDKSSYRLGEAARVRAIVRDSDGQMTKLAQVTLTLQSPDGSPPRQWPLTPVESRGMYELSLDEASSGDNGRLAVGDYTATVVAAQDGKELGRQELKFSVAPSQSEMTDTAANPALMKNIADATGGYSGELSGMPAMLDQLINSDTADSVALQQKTVPLDNTVRLVLAAAGTTPRWPSNYDLPMQGLLVVILLASEWILRRKWELP